MKFRYITLWNLTSCVSPGYLRIFLAVQSSNCSWLFSAVLNLFYFHCILVTLVLFLAVGSFISRASKFSFSLFSLSPPGIPGIHTSTFWYVYSHMGTNILTIIQKIYIVFIAMKHIFVVEVSCNSSVHEIMRHFQPSTAHVTLWQKRYGWPLLRYNFVKSIKCRADKKKPTVINVAY